ncbi:MAG: hypothetical protein QGG40_16155, partial [Myxococcota bacterium]|nr:hypothetical protein [Myxococcota bacterium]
MLRVLSSLVFVTTLGAAQADQIQVTGTGHAYNPAWSPDGQYLAFEMNRFEGNVDLFVVKLEGGNPIGMPKKVSIPGASSAFASGGGLAVAPNWHRNMLIFEGSNAGGTNRLYYWVPGGQSAAELLNISQVKGDLSWPTISPDGKVVAFVSDASGNGDLYLWERSSGTVSRALSSSFSEMAPRYSTDGQRMAYSRKNQGGEDIFIFSAGKTTPLVGGNGDQTRPAWSGERVVFFTNERGEDHWDIAVSSGPGNKKVLAKDVRLPLRSTPSLS